MSIDVAIFNRPLKHAIPWCVGGAGVLLCFEGVVRPAEEDRRIIGSRYETYDPMAQHKLEQLALDAVDRFSLLAAIVEHSRGFVPNFASAFRLRIASAHSEDAIAAMNWFLDRMKREVPIWKRPVYTDQSQEKAQ